MEKMLDYSTITRNESLTVTATSRNISEMGNSPQDKRHVIRIMNNSPNAIDIITVKFGKGNAVAGAGVILGVGEYIIDASSEGYECYQGDINCVCATANGVIAIFER